jgi:hypothetical protein
MKAKLLAGTAAALSLATITAASAQTYIEEPAYVEPAPAYVAPVAPAPGYIVSGPGYVVEAPPAYVAPRYRYATPRYRYTTPRSDYYSATYSAPAACTVDAYGNQYCD